VTAASPVSPAAVARLARGVLGAERVRDAALSVALVGRRRIRTLNRTHLGRDRQTDVLAFALTGARGGGMVVGDVYVCVPVALAQAARWRVSPREEVRRLVVHGVLHVLGYDHAAGRARTGGTMWRRQEGLLARLGGGRR
jgi:probable rRNA maturation factor